MEYGFLDFNDSIKFSEYSTGYNVEKVFTISNDLVISIKIMYSNIDNFLYMDVHNEEGEPIALGVKLIQGVDLLGSHKYKVLESGLSLVILQSNNKEIVEHVTYENFNETMVMYYAKK